MGTEGTELMPRPAMNPGYNPHAITPATPALGAGAGVTPYDAFQQMDAWDDEALLAELQGAVAKSLVYEFKQAGATVTGLSKVGVDECCMELVKRGEVIREEEIEVEYMGEGAEREAVFKVWAARYVVAKDGAGEVRLERVLGVKRQPLYQGGKLNPFWYEQGAMKAARNARFRLIPAAIREGVIAAAKKVGAVRGPSAREQPSGPASGVSGRAVRGDPYPEAIGEGGAPGSPAPAGELGSLEANGLEANGLAVALATTLPGKPEAWGGHGGVALRECPSSLLRGVEKWIRQRGDAELDPLLEAVQRVLGARVAGVVAEPGDVAGEG
jgi:hypothetical protein